VKRRHLRIIIMGTVLTALVVTTIAAAQDRLTDVGLQTAPDPAMPPAGQGETRQTLEVPELPITFYPTRADFNAANPGLPVEDFQDFTDALVTCDAPANNGTSCPGGYDAGDILPGLEIDCAANSGPGVGGLVIIPTGMDYNPSIIFSSNYFSDNTIINLSPAVDAIGLDASCHYGSPQMDIAVYDGNGALIWGGNHTPCEPTGFFLGWSTTDPAGIGRIELNDPSGASVESIDNVAFGSSGTGGFSAVFETDADAASGNEVAWEGFNSMNDFMSGTWYDYFYSAIDISGEWSMGGFASDALQYHLLIETNADAAGGAEVYFVTYESLDDFYTHTPAWEGYTAHNIALGWTTHGFASDGTRYYMVLESDADGTGGDEVYVMTYTSLANVISGTEESQAYSEININGVWSIADLAADGEKLYLVLETDADAGSGAEIYVITYSSFADLMSNTQESAAFSSLNVNADFSLNGFAADLILGGLPFSDGFESGNTSAWSTTVP
jgi:hypothetical protein